MTADLRPYIDINWRVKFRAFYITFAQYSDHKSIPLPGLPGDFGSELYRYDNHGVFIDVAVVWR